MEEYIYQIRKYLPVKFAENEANEFLKYLEESYIENLQHKKYQFAFKAFHMLYMAFIYKVTWFLNKQDSSILEELKKEYSIKIKKSDCPEITDTILTITKIFHQSQISEAKSILKLISLFEGFDNNDVDKCLAHIRVRNHCSHATGKIYYNEKAINHFISDELDYIAKIQHKTTKGSIKLFANFLDENWSKSFIMGDVKNWFETNYISQKDIECLLGVQLPLFKQKSDNEKNICKKVLYFTFICEAGKYVESEKNIFLERLPMFMHGIVPQIEIQIDDERKTVSMQKIIDERLMPLVGAMPDKERRIAEDVLQISS